MRRLSNHLKIIETEDVYTFIFILEDLNLRSKE